MQRATDMDVSAPHHRTEAVVLGPSLAGRARGMLAMTAIIAVTTVAVGLLRVNNVAEDTAASHRADRAARGVLALSHDVDQVSADVWHLEASPSHDSRRQLSRTLDALGRRVIAFEAELRQHASDDDVRAVLQAWGGGPVVQAGEGAPMVRPLKKLSDAVGRMRRALDPLLRPGAEGLDATKVRSAHDAVATANRDLVELLRALDALVGARRARVTEALSRAGRDLLVLLLALSIAGVTMVILGPEVMTAPIERLRQLAHRIDEGRVRALNVDGDDEVAVVGQAIARALRRLSERDHLKTSKLLELRKILRTVIDSVDAPVLIISRKGAIDYANAAVAKLLGRQAHQLEGQLLDECCFAPALHEAVARARNGDTDEDGFDVSIEGVDGRVHQARALLGSVQDQVGRVARVVAVLRV